MRERWVVFLFRRLTLALVNSKHLFAKLWRYIFHKAVTAEFDGIVLPKLQQVGFDGIGFAGIDTDLGYHVHADFS